MASEPPTFFPKIRFHNAITVFIVILSVLLCLTVFMIVHMEFKNAARVEAQRLFQQTSNQITTAINNLLYSAVLLAKTQALNPSLATQPAMDSPALPLLIKILELQPNIYSAYVGHPDGGFLQLIAARKDPDILRIHKAPQHTTWMVRCIQPVENTHGSKEHWQFLDHSLNLIKTRIEQKSSYDPRLRPWYGKAIQTPSVAITPPYIFHSLGKLGLTISSPLPDDGGAFGIDLTLKGINNYLKTATKGLPGKNTLIVIDENKRILSAHSDEIEHFDTTWAPLQDLSKMTGPIFTGINAVINENETASFSLFKSGTRDYLCQINEHRMPDGLVLKVLLTAQLANFTQYIKNMEYKILLAIFVVLLLLLPLAGFTMYRIAQKLILLAADAERIRIFDFSCEPPKGSVFLEVDTLDRAFYLMKRTILDRTQQLEVSQKKLEKLVELGITLTSARDVDTILQAILEGGVQLTNSDAGTLYLRTEDDRLSFSLRTLNDELPVDSIPMYDPETGDPNYHNLSTHVALTGETINIPDAYLCNAFDLSGTKSIDQATGYHSKSLLTVPLKPRDKKVIGVLQLINAMDTETGEIIPFGEEVSGFVEALAAQSAVALDNQRLIEAQKALFDSFVKLIAGAIDAKSPYTGGHCMRVPKIALMLAKAVNESNEEPFKDQVFNDDEMYEIHLAAWLHDCGKVTTPEYVMDKATKLETIYNRIHEIRTRFEVLRRDSEIVYLKALIDGRSDLEAARQQFDRDVAQLEDDFNFLANANEGAEFMEPEKKDRIKQIGARTWERHFDDCIGLSRAEKQRKHPEGSPDLPVTESLLADKLEHIVPWHTEEKQKQLAEVGVRMDVPEVQYNFGEIYNLCIDRGTLTKEERFKIKDHVIQTIAMLEKLPFTESTRNVSKIAGAHHERIIGSGYPRKLKKHQMSVQARIMAIADIFEALTASDRPYKKTKTLSEAIQILGSLKKDEHIDPDLFRLFLTSGIYKEYGKQFLKPDQIDKVEIHQYLTE